MDERQAAAKSRVVAAFDKALQIIEEGITAVLAVIIVFIVIVALTRIMSQAYHSLFQGLFSGHEIAFASYTDIFGKMLTLLISIEFMNSITKVLRTHEMKALVLDVSLITALAICRRIIVMELAHPEDGTSMIAFAVMLVGLAVFHYLVGKGSNGIGGPLSREDRRAQASAKAEQPAESSTRTSGSHDEAHESPHEGAHIPEAA